jgi:hypothetical protein
MRWTAVSNDSSSRQLGASLAPTVCQNGAAGTRPHAQAEAVLAGTTTVVGLVRTLAHEWFLTQGVESSQTLAPYPGIARHPAPVPWSGNEVSTATARSQIYVL